MIDDDMHKNAVDRACDRFAEQEFLGDARVPNACLVTRHDDRFGRRKPECGTHLFTPHVQRATPQFGPVAALKVRACQGRTLIGIGLSQDTFDDARHAIPSAARTGSLRAQRRISR